MTREWLIELGRLMEMVSQLHAKQDEHSQQINGLRQEFDQVASWGKRAALVLLLWGAAAGLKLEQDEIADKLAEVLRMLLTTH